MNESYQWSDEEDDWRQHGHVSSNVSSALTATALKQLEVHQPNYQQLQTPPPQSNSPPTTRLNFLFQEFEKEYVSVVQENEFLKQRLEDYERVMAEHGIQLPPSQQLQAIKSKDKKLSTPGTGQRMSQMDKLKQRTRRLTNIQKVRDFVQKSKANLIGLPAPVHDVVYNWTNREIVKRYYYHSDIVNYVQSVPTYGSVKGSPMIASCSMDQTVCLFSLADQVDANGSVIRVVQRPDFMYKGHKGAVNTIAFHPTNPIACSASGDATIHLWKWNDSQSVVPTSVPKLERRESANEPEAPPKEVATLSRENSKFHMPSLDLNAAIDYAQDNNLQTDEQLSNDETEGSDIATQDLLSTSEFMSMMEEDHDKIPSRSTPLMVLDHDGSVVVAAQYHQGRSSADHSIVSGSWDRCIRQWDVTTGKLITKMMHHDISNSSSSASGAHYVPNYEGRRNNIHISDLQSAYHNPWIVTAMNNGLCKIWDSVSNQVTYQFHHSKSHEHSTNMETCAIFTPSDRNIITATQDGSCKIWDMRKLSEKNFLKSFSVHSGVNRISISSYHSRFCLATNKKQIKIYDLSGKCLDTLQKQGHEMMVTGVSWSDNGEDIFSCSADRSVIQWKIQNNENN